MKATHQISKELVKRGHEVIVYTTDAKDPDSRLDVEPIKIVDGIKVNYMKNLSMMFIKKLNVFLTLEMASKAEEELKIFNIIHLHDYRTYQNIVIHYYAERYNVPYIFQAHGSLPRIMEKQKLKWVYDMCFGYRLLRDASSVIALTQTEAQQYRDMGVPEEKIEIIPNGIDLSEYENLPPKGSFKKKFNIHDNKKIVLYLGRIHRIKGIDILVKAFYYAIKMLNFDNALLVIVGSDDGYLDELERMLTSLNITDSVLLTGPLYGKDKLEAYLDADVFVLPSRYETFPNVVLEAYSCSRPVIASNVESIPDIVIHGKTGLLFRSGDAEELAKMIMRMITHPEEAEKMGCRARKLVEEKYSIESVVSSLETLYERVLYSKYES